MSSPSKAARSGLRARTSWASLSSTPTQPGPLSTHLASTTSFWLMPSACVIVMRSRVLDRAVPQQRRRLEREPLAPLDRHQPGAALLDDVGSLRRTAGLEPRVRAAERRMTGERQLAAGREDPQPVVGPSSVGRSKNVVSERLVHCANRCIWASSRSSASWTTATGLPSSGAGEKTSTWRNGCMPPVLVSAGQHRRRAVVRDAHDDPAEGGASGRRCAAAARCPGSGRTARRRRRW